MTKRIFMTVFLVGVTVLCMPAWAGKGEQDGALKVLCQSLPVYRPDPGVEYRPGVDVHGRAVAPADLNVPLNVGVDEVIRIPVTVDLVRRFNLYPAAGIELEPDVGVISIHSDGRVEYNGQDLARQAYTLCARDTKIVK